MARAVVDHVCQAVLFHMAAGVSYGFTGLLSGREEV